MTFERLHLGGGALALVHINDDQAVYARHIQHYLPRHTPWVYPELIHVGNALRVSFPVPPHPLRVSRARNTSMPWPTLIARAMEPRTLASSLKSPRNAPMEGAPATEVEGIACAGVDPLDSVRSARQGDVMPHLTIVAVMSGAIEAGEGQMLSSTVDGHMELCHRVITGERVQEFESAMVCHVEGQLQPTLRRRHMVCTGIQKRCAAPPALGATRAGTTLQGRLTHERRVFALWLRLANPNSISRSGRRSRSCGTWS
jgi:hypothetical protein